MLLPGLPDAGRYLAGRYRWPVNGDEHSHAPGRGLDRLEGGHPGHCRGLLQPIQLVRVGLRARRSRMQRSASVLALLPQVEINIPTTLAEVGTRY